MITALSPKGQFTLAHVADWCTPLEQVVPDVTTPVAKIMDFKKHRHAQSQFEKKVEKKMREKAKMDTPKEVRLRYPPVQVESAVR